MLFPLERTCSKLGLERQSSKFRWYSSWSNTNFEQIIARWCYIKSFSGIDISCLFRGDRFSLISSDSANTIQKGKHLIRSLRKDMHRMLPEI